jgi:hypothetical protein
MQDTKSKPPEHFFFRHKWLLIVYGIVVVSSALLAPMNLRFGDALHRMQAGVQLGMAVTFGWLSWYWWRTWKHLRIPVILATQSGAKLPLIPVEGCHPIRSKVATPSERSDATWCMGNLKSSWLSIGVYMRPPLRCGWCRCAMPEGTDMPPHLQRKAPPVMYGCQTAVGFSHSHSFS